METAAETRLLEIAKCYFKNSFLKILNLRRLRLDRDELPLGAPAPSPVCGYILPSGRPEPGWGQDEPQAPRIPQSQPLPEAA